MIEDQEKETIADKTSEDELSKRYNWMEKLKTRDEKFNYLKTALRYWYSKEWYGSEKTG
ncbi:MAG: hypothetical protein N2596_05320 [Syntrophorhabdaceae bacterium]|nr:hypothetical protein [Syntrophorhabdaceae bacterium]